MADFARAPNDEDDTSSDDGDAGNIPHGDGRPATTEPYGYAGGSNGTQYYSSNQYDADRQYAGGLALPPMRTDGVQVKAEPDELIRPRGGAVSRVGIRLADFGRVTYTV